MTDIKKTNLVKKAGHYFGFLKRAGRHQKGRTLQHNIQQEDKEENCKISGAECRFVWWGAWTLRSGDIQRLEPFEMWTRMERMSWTERVVNDRVLQSLGEKRCLLTSKAATEEVVRT